MILTILGNVHAQYKEFKIVEIVNNILFLMSKILINKSDKSLH
jgi:hypothetical protein